jgi:protein-tyrosine phosphatase
MLYPFILCSCTVPTVSATPSAIPNSLSPASPLPSTVSEHSRITRSSSSDSALSTRLRRVQDLQNGSAIAYTHSPNFLQYPTEIIPEFLYLGSHIDAKNNLHLSQLSIRHIINLSSEIFSLPSNEANHFTCEDFSIPDEKDAEIFPLFTTICEKLAEYEKAQDRVLIYSFNGISRSACITIAYLMISRSWTLSSAYRFTKRQRRVIFPNIGFWHQLAKWEAKIWSDSEIGLTKVDSFGTISDREDRGGWIVGALTPKGKRAGFQSSLEECVDVYALQKKSGEATASMILISPEDSENDSENIKEY